MADPAFAQKMAIEQLLAASSNLYWEYRQRGDRFFKCAPCPCQRLEHCARFCSCMPSTRVQQQTSPSSVRFVHHLDEATCDRELDLVAVNTLSVAAATGALVWLVAPSRSFGTLHKSSWQNMLHNLPHNVFDTSTPLRKYTLGSRAGGLAW